MTHKIKSIQANENYCVRATFFDGNVKEYCMKKLFDTFPQFKIFMSNKELYKQVSVDVGGYGISWNEELDLDAETIWEDGVFIEVEKEPDLHHLLAYQISIAREKANMTQKELSEATGIYQADISKLERGIGNPSIDTLRRIAQGMGMKLNVEFI